MRKISTCIALLLSLVASISYLAARPIQPTELPRLQHLIDVLEVAIGWRFSWKLMVYGDGKIKSSKDVIVDLDSWLQLSFPDKDSQHYIVEQKLAEKYKAAIVNIFDGLDFIGRHSGGFFYDEGYVPFRFALKDSIVTLIVTGIASNDVYNTLKTTARSRAAKIVESMILPSLEKFYDALDTTDIRKFGMMVTYGSKNFAKKSDVLNLEAEVIAFIVDMDACKRFVDAEITDEELVNLSDVYVSDRDMMGTIKKVKISLE